MGRMPRGHRRARQINPKRVAQRVAHDGLTGSGGDVRASDQARQAVVWCMIRVRQKLISALEKVDSALAWHAVHLAANPSMKQVAAAIHVSPSHLRRLFWQVRASSPKAAFQKARLERAQEIMTRSALTLDEVARLCGFASASHLCRDYKAVHKITPTFWRKKIIAKDPAPPAEPADPK